jgi:molecular chaperone DnaK
MAPIIPVGIDLGTSFCAVSYINVDGGSQMIPGADGETLTPSAVHFGDDQVLVGRQAWNAALATPDRLAESAKRDMGAKSFREPIDGREYPPEVIQSCVLRQLRRDIVEAVGENFQAVVTVPAYFDEARRKSTWDAAIMSGLPLLDIVNEPTAAALAFGERLGYLTTEGTPRERLNVLVYDIGGGTFDVTVIRLAAAEIRALSTDGDCELGGLNWDQRIAEYAESRFQALWPDVAALEPSDQMRLLRAARDAKHRLTDRPVTVLEFSQGDHHLKLPVTREELEDLTSDLLDRTAFTTRQALQASGLIWSEIDRLLLVGGSSRMPAVRRMLNELSGITPDATVSPDEAVARGAAVYARYLMGLPGHSANAPKLRIADVNSHSLGVEGVNLQTMRTENVALIPRNSSLPCEIKRTFVTRTDNQPNVKVQLLEGESSVPAHCSRLATATIKNLPPGLPKGTPIDVRYSLQSNGRLVVSAAIPGHGDDAQIELQRVRGLEDRRVQGWKRIVCRDGGYRDYADALSMLYAPDFEECIPADQYDDEGVLVEPKTNANLEPAVGFGAPRVAADTLKTRFRLAASNPASMPVEQDNESADWLSIEQSSRKNRARATKTQPRVMSNLVGVIFGGILGTFLGYYLLCCVRPDLNHFGLKLPGISDVDQDGK